MLEKREVVLERVKRRFSHIPSSVSLAEELVAERRAEAREASRLTGGHQDGCHSRIRRLPMSDQDLRQLRQVLRQAVDASRMPVREMERRLGVGHGSLYRMLDGEFDLRVRHLLALAEILGVSPADFLEMGCPDAVRNAKRHLADWIGTASQTSAAGPAAASLSLDALKDLVRETVREEIDKREPEIGSKTRRSRR